MDEDSDSPLATTPPRPQKGAAPRSPKRAPETPVDPFENWKALFLQVVVYAILGGIAWGAWAGFNWVKEQFETAESAAEKATKCYADAKVHPSRMKECDKLADRADALRMRAEADLKRAEAEKFCTDKGLKFKGTIGDQVECEP